MHNTIEIASQQSPIHLNTEDKCVKHITCGKHDYIIGNDFNPASLLKDTEVHNHIIQKYGNNRDYVRKYFNVQNRACVYRYMHHFNQFCAQLPSINHIKNNRCENRAFAVKTMRDFTV